MQTKVSKKTIRRLSHYARCLRMAMLRGEHIMTSQQMANNCGISSAAVRRDLSSYGEFGRQGSGYNVPELLATIEEILGTTSPPDVIVIGAGNMGCALLRSGLEGTGGYAFSGIFDIDPNKAGKTCAGMAIRPVEEIPGAVGENPDVIAVMAVTPGQGQKALETLASAGIRAVLSFNLEPLQAPDGVNVRYVEVPTELDVLTHFIRRQN